MQNDNFAAVVNCPDEYKLIAHTEITTQHELQQSSTTSV